MENLQSDDQMVSSICYALAPRFGSAIAWSLLFVSIQHVEGLIKLTHSKNPKEGEAWCDSELAFLLRSLIKRSPPPPPPNLKEGGVVQIVHVVDGADPNAIRQSTTPLKEPMIAHAPP